MKKITCSVSVLALLMAFVIAAAQQPGTGSLDGVAVKDGSGDPLSNASIELRAGAGNNALLTAFTDNSGQFSFPKVPAGDYRISAMRSGLMLRSALNLSVVAGTRQTIRLALTPGGVISGHVTDRGKPSGAALVSALKVSYVNGQRILTQVLSTYTDDLGDYHLFWLPPGRYYVGALAEVFPDQVELNPDPNSPAMMGAGRGNNALPPVALGTLNKKIVGIGDQAAYVRTFPPNKTDWREATPIDLPASGEVRGLAIDLSPVPIQHVRGKVTGAGVNAAGMPVLPVVRLINVNLGDVISGPTDAAGSFDLPVTMPGTYIVSASASSGGAGPLGRGATRGGGPPTPLSAQAGIELYDRDIDGISLILASGSISVSGTLVVEKPAFANVPGMPLQITLRPDPWYPGLPEFTIQPNTNTRPDDGQNKVQAAFTTPALVPGDYRVSVTPVMSATFPPVPDVLAARNAYAQLQNLEVKSIQLGDVDLLKNVLHLSDQLTMPLEITLVEYSGTIEGEAINLQRQPAAGATVAVVPEDPNRRFRVRNRTAITDVYGHFRLSGLAPGDYKLFAWDDVDNGAWQESEFLRGMEGRGKVIHIGEGGKSLNVTIDLTPSKP
jgi:hypothetical protein